MTENAPDIPEFPDPRPQPLKERPRLAFFLWVGVVITVPIFFTLFLPTWLENSTKGLLGLLGTLLATAGIKFGKESLDGRTRSFSSPIVIKTLSWVLGITVVLLGLGWSCPLTISALPGTEIYISNAYHSKVLPESNKPNPFEPVEHKVFTRWETVDILLKNNPLCPGQVETFRRGFPRWGKVISGSNHQLNISSNMQISPLVDFVDLGNEAPGLAGAINRDIRDHWQIIVEPAKTQKNYNPLFNPLFVITRDKKTSGILAPTLVFHLPKAGPSALAKPIAASVDEGFFPGKVLSSAVTTEDPVATKEVIYEAIRSAVQIAVKDEDLVVAVQNHLTEAAADPKFAMYTFGAELRLAKLRGKDKQTAVANTTTPTSAGTDSPPSTNTSTDQNPANLADSLAGATPSPTPSPTASSPTDNSPPQVVAIQSADNGELAKSLAEELNDSKDNVLAVNWNVPLPQSVALSYPSASSVPSENQTTKDPVIKITTHAASAEGAEDLKAKIQKVEKFKDAKIEIIHKAPNRADLSSSPDLLNRFDVSVK